MNDAAQRELERFEGMILEQMPDARFKLEPSDQEGIWHLSIFTPDGKLQMPARAAWQLNQIWREHKLSIVTTIYPASLYQEENP